MEDLTDQAELELLLQHPGQWPDFGGYKALDVSNRQIRVLHISHGPNSEIHCTVAHVGLSDGPRYEALSYCWGSPDKRRAMHVDNTVVLIRSSLYQFLDALCHQRQSLPIWVDSICINQRDTKERSWQVSMMSDIYRAAAGVKAWLGPADPYTEYFFIFQKHSQNQAVTFSANLKQIKSLATEGLMSLADRPYWKRLWIVQEIALSRKLTVMCGTRLMDWSTFLDTFQESTITITNTLSELDHTRRSLNATFIPHDTLSCAESLHSELNQKVESTTHMDTLHRPVPAVSPTSILARMTQFRTRACQDLRDKIYATIGMAADGDSMTVDYSKSFSSVLMDAIVLSFDTWKSWVQRNLIGQPEAKLLELNNLSRTTTESRPERISTASMFMGFVNDASFHIQWLEDLTADRDDLFFPTDPGTDLALSHQLEISSRSPLAPKEGHRIQDPDSQFCVKSSVYLSGLISSGWNQIFVSWDGQNPPKILGFDRWEKGKHDLEVAECLEFFVRNGGIRLCPQVYLRTYSALDVPSCVFVVHYDRAAMLAVICLQARSRWWKNCTNMFGYKSQKASSNIVCNCNVSVDLNKQAFAAYTNDTRTQWIDCNDKNSLSEKERLAL